jgi:hypothetical protein
MIGMFFNNFRIFLESYIILIIPVALECWCVVEPAPAGAQGIAALLSVVAAAPSV